MYDTRNDLPLEVRSAVTQLLNARLADGIDLMLQAKQAHWNVRGANFLSLHQLFDAIADEIEESVDTMAERATALGAIAEGTVPVVAQRSVLKAHPLGISRGREHLEALSGATAQFAQLARRAIEEATRLQDADTADLFTEISRATDKLLWMLEAHLSEDR